MHLAVYSYFSAGGSQALCVRATRATSDSAGPATASYTFQDRNSSPQQTMMISADNPGAWGSQIYIDILDGTLPKPFPNNNTFTIVVKYMGSGQSNIVESWANLSMTPGSNINGVNNYAPDIVNSPFTGSSYIELLDLGSSSTSPANNPSDTTSSVHLAGGSDGSQITFQNITTAMTLLDQYPDQPFVLNVPGLSDVGTVGTITGYAESRGDLFLVVDPPPGLVPADMVNYVANFAASAHAAVYYPQVAIGDPFSPVQGRTRLVPPGGFVVGRYISTDASRGVAKAPAGVGASLLGVYGLERNLTNSDQGVLTQSNVNCLVSIPGSGVVIWGARTLSPYLITRYVPVERTLIYLRIQLIQMTRFAVFEPNDYVLWNQISSILSQFLSSFWHTGGLRGTTDAEAYYVTCDASNNTQTSIQQGIVNVEVGVALQDPAEFIVISIGQWAGGTTVTATA
jgi:hypothetical protein